MSYNVVVRRIGARRKADLVKYVLGFGLATLAAAFTGCATGACNSSSTATTVTSTNSSSGGGSTGSTTTSATTSGTAGAVVLTAANLVFEGSFRVPEGDFGAPEWTGFTYGGTALAFNPTNSSLFVVGHDHHHLAAEISVPKIVDSNKLSDLATAKVLQPFADPTDGLLGTVDDDTIKVGDLLVSDGQLYGTVYTYYDADASQLLSSFVRSTTLSQASTKEMVQVGTLGAGLVSGYMAHIPAAWQAALGAPALIGQCCIPIVSRTSYGPSAFAFDPAHIGQQSPVPATPLLYYPTENPLAAWESTGTLFNGATMMGGLVFPKGSRSLLFFGRQGIGSFCYDTGPACNDPTDDSKGCHAYPYITQVWAYDVLDLLAVKNGEKKPWELSPTTWELTLPFASADRIIVGTTYDPATQRIFLSSYRTDGDLPLIHVLEVELPES